MTYTITIIRQLLNILLNPRLCALERAVGVKRYGAPSERNNMNLRNSVIRHLMAERLDFAAALGQAAGGGEVAALLDALGPWEVKAYPAVGKHPASEYRNAKPHGVQLCFEAEVGARARAPPGAARQAGALKRGCAWHAHAAGLDSCARRPAGRRGEWRQLLVDCSAFLQRRDRRLQCVQGKAVCNRAARSVQPSDAGMQLRDAVIE